MSGDEGKRLSEAEIRQAIEEQAKIAESLHKAMQAIVRGAVAESESRHAPASAHTAALLAMVDTEQILALCTDMPYEKMQERSTGEFLAEQREATAHAVEAGRKVYLEALSNGAGHGDALRKAMERLFRLREESLRQAGLPGVPEDTSLH